MTLRPDFKAHRNRLLEQLGEHEAVLLFGASHHIRNGDAEYRYRPSSDVYWLTGWEDPEVAVFLKKGEEPLTLFVQAKNPQREIWEGFRHGPEGAKQHFGADVAFTWPEVAEQLVQLIQGVDVLHYGFAEDAEQDALLTGAIRKARRAAKRNGLTVPETFHAPSKLLHELRLHKCEDELKVMAEAARISALAHTRCMERTRPGMSEYELEAILHQTFMENGSTGAGYTPIVASGANACTLHYITNRGPVRDGDLVLIDAGCEVNYYTADITRTYPANGRFSPAQRDLYEVVLAAQLASIDACRAGLPFQGSHDATLDVLIQGMIDLELLTGSPDEIKETESYKQYYMHGTSHWLGLDVHDVGAYASRGTSRPLAPGMVLTVEPGLYIATDDDSAPEAFRGIGIRIEDDVVVTEGDPTVLTADVVKSIDDIEAVCGGR